MPNYRRAKIAGGTFFFTVVTFARRPIFHNKMAAKTLGDCIRRCKARWPFTVKAMVLLPDHWHTIWTLPPNDHEYSMRIGWIKKEFTKAWGKQSNPNSHLPHLTQQRRHEIWQPRFWEHTIQEEDEFEVYFDYIHWNPVKHKYVETPTQWKHSTIHRWIDKDVYPKDWGGGNLEKRISGLAKFGAGEP